jgi:hypothetical protein
MSRNVRSGWIDVLCGPFDTRDRDWLCEAHAARISDLRPGDDVVVVDPLGLVPTFLAITHGLASRSRSAVALRACLIAAAILAGAALIGDTLLRTLSIGLPVFRIAGGLLLFSIDLPKSGQF